MGSVRIGGIRAKNKGVLRLRKQSTIIDQAACSDESWGRPGHIWLRILPYYGKFPFRNIYHLAALPRMTKPAQANQNSYTRKPVERRPLPNRLVRLLSEARWFALAAFALYFVLILASFNKLDPGWSISEV